MYTHHIMYRTRSEHRASEPFDVFLPWSGLQRIPTGETTLGQVGRVLIRPLRKGDHCIRVCIGVCIGMHRV